MYFWFGAVLQAIGEAHGANERVWRAIQEESDEFGNREWKEYLEFSMKYLFRKD